MGEMADIIQDSIENAEASQPEPQREQIDLVSNKKILSKDELHERIKEKISLPGEDQVSDSEDLIDDDPDWDQPSSSVQTYSSPQREQLETMIGNAYKERAMAEAEYNRINWGELRRDDPAEFAAQQQDFQIRFNTLAKQEAYISQEANKLKDTHRQKSAQQMNEYIQNEQAKLLSVIPAWKDEKVRAREAQKINSYLKKNGFTDTEINGIVDHRQIKLIRNAVLAEQRAKKAKVKARVKSRKRNTTNYTPEELRVLRERPHGIEATTIRVRKILDKSDM
ncbi:MAG: hypothetical protein B6D73_15190 [gamma proteobacterium symbiont of Stewartia floridana]|nr:MAG: hypothetical protein B6D73_15190 [gamma proteobacterium symbiont of Stewartia floridana]